MMSSNKILTVSYGTFSCTLEGFDDSFDTMKAIAEYFRDLAADDRYFGAEPPQPDAEMLARIAEREVSRRVEAREHEGRIMLKAHEETAEVEPEPAPVEDVAPATAAAAAVVAAAAAQPDVAEDTEEETQAFSAPYTDTPEPPADVEIVEAPIAPVAEAAPVYEAPVAPLSEPDTEMQAEADPVDDLGAYEDAPSAEDLEDLAALDGDTPTEETEDFAEDIETTPADMDAAAAFFAGSVVNDGLEPETEDTISVEAFTGYISAAEPASDADATVDSDALAAADVADDEAHDVADLIDETVPDETILPARDDLILDEGDAPQAGFTTESFADKLARIRAVVTKQDKTIEPQAYDDEESEAITGFAETADPTSAEGSEPAGMPEMAVEDDADTDQAADVVQHLDTDDEIAAVAAEIEEAFDADATAQMEITEEEGDDLDAILDEIEASGGVEDIAPDAIDSPQIGQSETAVVDAAVSEDAMNIFDDADPQTADAVAIDAETTDSEDGAEDQTPAAAVAGRMMTTPRDAFEEALASGELEDMDAAAEIVQDTAVPEDEDAEDITNASPSTARDALPEIGENAGEDVSRLMAEADQQMEEPEGRTRRSAFAHLRAAVAARFADRSMDAEAQEAEEQEEAYRSDLAEVVKPRRPETHESPQHSRPDTRPAPLKLVAEQRIDEANPAKDTSVAPRRVAAPEIEEAEMPEESGFAAYAEERGATTLPELLEAAASYLCFVEGQDEFSRPQLMTRVRQADVGEFTREDGLRSFGQLLRTGKIEKIAGGRFVASDAIGYKPDHRAAG